MLTECQEIEYPINVGRKLSLISLGHETMGMDVNLQTQMK